MTLDTLAERLPEVAYFERRRAQWYDGKYDDYDVDEAICNGQRALAACAVEVERLEAELAALKARRCDECDSREGQSHYCLLWSINTPDAHACNEWATREEASDG